MTVITIDPMVAARDLFTLRGMHAVEEIGLRWVLAWSALFVTDRSAMAKAIAAETDTTVANAFRNASTATLAMSKGFDGGMPDDATRAHVEQWSPKTWQQIGAKVISAAAIDGTLCDLDPTAVRAEQDEAKASVSSPSGEVTDLAAAPMASLDQIANAIYAVLSREPQWEGMSVKNRATLSAGVIDDLTARVAKLTASAVA